MVYKQPDSSRARGDDGSLFHSGRADAVYIPRGMFADGILCALILLLISVGSMGKWLDKSPFALVGRISYELYLWMYPIIFLFGYYKKNFYPVSWCVQIILMVLRHLRCMD